MDPWNEHIEKLESLRTEYGSISRGVLIILASRAALLITSATLIGTITNIYFSGLSSFKIAKVMPTGDVISLMGNTPRALMATFIAMLIGLVIIAIYSFDDELNKIQTSLIARGQSIEVVFQTGDGMFHQIKSLEQAIQNGFMIARSVLFVIGSGWAMFFVVLGFGWE